ncbi:hypothetical protein CJF40_11765 [Pseudomonas lundensis]|uniref:Uncharacterized protein n=1 Tax=Pseudomonas lundensis TaxID=86185 RepID=A0ABX4GLH3_9PSED|nr:hypothetical protein AA042_01715 [Pseudomonas lundensis]OZY27862.1 hypothetical protein CJF40_11765 [Pseudomonas lundensis]OZY37262.1 hypothetical protein CJF35_09530 [Pseudomonas lundensis]OZY54976.1 hypothetical protein CJF38_11040 [Pseudomonas lundensis]
MNGLKYLDYRGSVRESQARVGRPAGEISSTRIPSSDKHGFFDPATLPDAARQRLHRFRG